MVFTRLAAVKKKKYNLPTVSNFNSKMNDNDGVSNNVNDSTNEIIIIAETQTQIVEATQNTDVLYGYPEAPTEDLADLGEICTTKLKKLLQLMSPMEKKARTKHQAISPLHLHSRRLDLSTLVEIKFFHK